MIQFEKVRFKETFPKGGWKEYTFPHHTAIVYGVKGSKLTLIHQNVNGVKRVVVKTYNLDHRQSGGTMTAYRPQPR